MRSSWSRSATSTIAQGATTLAIWSADHLTSIEPLFKRYGRSADARPALLRSALLGGTRVGAVGELADITDLAALVQKVLLNWLIVMQGARELHDPELLDVASRAHDHSRRQLAWLTTMVEHEAPDAVSIVPDRRGQLAASLPKRPTSIASIPDSFWGPVVAAILLLVVGVLGLVAGSPWLVPSLGPTAVVDTSNITINSDGRFDMNNFGESINNLVINQGNVINVPATAGLSLRLEGTLDMTGGSINGGLTGPDGGLHLGGANSDVTATSDAAGNAALLAVLVDLGGITRTSR